MPFIRLLLLSTLLSISAVIPSKAQSIIIPDINRHEFGSVKAIRNDISSKVAGYYIFYRKEKGSGGFHDYVLELFDKDLNRIKNQTFKISKHADLSAEVANDSSILLVFQDFRKKRIQVISIAADGKVLAERYMKIKRGRGLHGIVAAYAVEDGFILSKYVKGKRYGAELEYMDNHLKKKWAKSYTTRNGEISVMNVRGEGPHIYVQVQDQLRDRKARFNIFYDVLRRPTGTSISKISMVGDDKVHYPHHITFTDKGQILLLGEYYEGKRMKGYPDGVFIGLFERDGTTVSASYERWKNEIQDKVRSEIHRPLLLSGRIRLFIESIYEDDQGNYHIVGEAYRISSKLLGLGFNPRVLGSPGENANQVRSTLHIMDFVILTFTPKCELLNVQFVSKEKTKVLLYPPYHELPEHAMSLAWEYGYSNYGFTIQDDQGTTLVGTFEEKSEIVMGLVDLNDKSEDLPVKKILIADEYKGDAGILPHSREKVVSWVYDKKEKMVKVDFIYFTDAQVVRE